jgi:hypothetical protein
MTGLAVYIYSFVATLRRYCVLRWRSSKEHKFNTQHYWVSGVCPPSGILKTTEHKVSETVYLPSTLPGLRYLYSCSYTDRVVQWLRLALSKQPNRVGVSHLIWGWKQIQFPKRCVF